MSKNMRVAVVGGGVSGLAAAYVLAKEGAEVVVYEKEDVLGGRAKTVALSASALDLGFMVFTTVMYEDVMELLESVGVDIEFPDASFSVSLDEGSGYEWGTRNGLSSLFTQRKNAFNPWFWKMIREITRFKNDASIYLEDVENNSDIDKNGTLGFFVESHGYSELFQKAFIPTCASLWACSSEVIMSFSAYSVLPVLCNHHVLERLGNSQRVTSRWRSECYVDRMKRELENRGGKLRTKSEVCSVVMNKEGCGITSKDGVEEAFDECIIGVDAPDALNILGKQATYDELTILGAFTYAYSDIFIHRDNNLMPKSPAAWASTNFLGSINKKSCVTYWLNNLQNTSESGAPFLMTINPPKTPKNTLYKWSTRHPIPTVAASKASSKLNTIQGKRGLWFCGSYQGCGFLEDGVQAGIVAAKGVLTKTYSVHKVSKGMVPSFLEFGARILVTTFLQRLITTGCLILLEEGGSILKFQGRKKSTLKVTLRIHKPQFYWKVATEADIGFADAYINGDFSFVDKNEGLFNFFLVR